MFFDWCVYLISGIYNSICYGWKTIFQLWLIKLDSVTEIQRAVSLIAEDFLKKLPWVSKSVCLTAWGWKGCCCLGNTRTRQMPCWIQRPRIWLSKLVMIWWLVIIDYSEVQTQFGSGSKFNQVMFVSSNMNTRFTPKNIFSISNIVDLFIYNINIPPFFLLFIYLIYTPHLFTPIRVPNVPNNNINVIGPLQGSTPYWTFPRTCGQAPHGPGALLLWLRAG